MAVKNIPNDWQRGVSLARYTTLQVGGPAEFFVTVSNCEELQMAITCAQALAIPVTIIGGGSNVLVADAGVPGLVIHMAVAGVERLETDEQVKFRCGAGINFDTLVADTVAAGWWGLENLSAIPGTVGATPIQNVGAYGVEVADVIESVEVYDYRLERAFTLSAKQCKFSYRYSIFKSEEARYWIVTAVIFTLSRLPCPKLAYPDLAPLREHKLSEPGLVRQHVIDVRNQKFPDWKVVGTAGSFFKNPVVDIKKYQQLQIKYPDLPGYPTTEGMMKIPLGWILDRVCGLRGYQDGAVATYDKQALVLVQTGGATTADIQRVAHHIQDSVLSATGINIEYEVTTLPEK